MKYEIEINEMKPNEMYLHQEGFTLSKDEEEDPAVEFHTTVPGGFPYINIRSGKNAGKRFIIRPAELQKLCEFLVDA